MTGFEKLTNIVTEELIKRHNKLIDNLNNQKFESLDVYENFKSLILEKLKECFELDSLDYKSLRLNINDLKLDEIITLLNLPDFQIIHHYNLISFEKELKEQKEDFMVSLKFPIVINIRILSISKYSKNFKILNEKINNSLINNNDIFEKMYELIIKDIDYKLNKYSKYELTEESMGVWNLVFDKDLKNGMARYNSVVALIEKYNLIGYHKDDCIIIKKKPICLRISEKIKQTISIIKGN